MPKTAGLQYDAQWFSQHEAAWNKTLRPWLDDKFHGDGFLHLLEIGSYEGLSSSWLLETALEIARGGVVPGVAHLTCVDAWPGPEYKPLRDKCCHNLLTVAAAYNTSPEQCFRVYEAPSSEVLSTLQPNHFHFIYVDGSHKEPDVYSDTIDAVRLVRPGGVILWDDYCCLTTPGEEKEQVMAGVDRALIELGIPREDVKEDFGHHLRWIKPKV